MSIRVTCPTCQYKLNVPEAGKRHACPNCQSLFVAGKPAAETTASAAPQPAPADNKTMLGETEPPIKFHCPRCRKPLEVAAVEAGTKRPCPACGQRLQVPAAPAPAGAFTNLNKTILADPDAKPSPSGIQPGLPAAKPSSESAPPTRAGRAAPRARPRSNRGLLIGGGLVAGGFVVLVLLACVASIFWFNARKRQVAAELVAMEEKIRMEHEAAAARMAEMEARRRKEQEAAQRREQEQQDLAQFNAAAAEAKRQEQEALNRQARDEEQKKRIAADQQALKELQEKQAKQTKALQEAANKQPVIIAPGLDLNVNGLLAPGQFNRYRQDSYCKIHPVPMRAGHVYVIALFSPWDNYLHLESPGGTFLAADDDSGGGLNARIVFSCPADGVYRIIVSSYGARVTGGYNLRVSH